MSRQTLLYAGLIAWLAVLWAFLVYQRESPLGAAVVALLSSPILLLVLRQTLEKGEPAGLFSPATQSWAFLFGDVLWLPASFAAAAYGQRFVQDDSKFHSHWWLAGCVVIGVVAGVVFHKLDQEVYVLNGHGLALVSPTKLAHDFVAYPLLFGGLLFLGLPVLVHRFWWAGATALIGVLLWGLMGVADAKRSLDPKDLHPKWNERAFSGRD